jgi:hypothetical protein
LTDVIGQISWHDVKKSAITMVFPLRELRVKLVPALSKSSTLRTSAGTGALSIVPPPGAAAPWPTASGVEAGWDIEVFDVDVPQLVKSASVRSIDPKRIDLLVLMSKGYVEMLELSSYSSNI